MDPDSSPPLESGSLLSIPGYARDGEWLVSFAGRGFRAWLSSTPCPRPFGAVQQVKADLQGPSRWLYVVVVGLIAYAAARASVPAAVMAVSIVAVFARNFMAAIKLRRRGIITTARLGTVQQAFKTTGVNQGVAVDGISMNVGFELAAVRAILATGSEVDVQVIYDPSETKPVAHGLAYREVARPAPVAVEHPTGEAAESDAPAAAAAITCALCNGPVVGRSYLVNSKIACATCVAKVREELAAQVPSGTPIFLAIAGGLVGALVGAAVWAGVAIATQLEVGYVAVLIGYLAGQGVKRGAGKQRGPMLQYLAAGLSVVGLVAAKYMLFAYAVVQLAHERGLQFSYFDARIRATFPRALTEMISAFDVLFVVLALAAAYRVPKAHGVTIVER